jgi:hypothetical protein
MLGQIGSSWITGRSKRDIPLPILKNEPMGRYDEYTCYVDCQALRNGLLAFHRGANLGLFPQPAIRGLLMAYMPPAT